MSREIDVDVNDAEALQGLDEGDLRYLLERDRVPAEVKRKLDLGDLDQSKETTPLSKRANTGTVRTMTTEELEAELERRRAASSGNPNKPDNSNPSFADEDEEEDYSTWNTEELRTELARRELSVSGKKEELIKRLEEDDESDEES